MVHGIIWWIVVGLIAGWAAGKIMKGGGYGVVADILLGIVGGIVGGWIVGFFGGGGGGFISSILVAILGAVVLIELGRHSNTHFSQHRREAGHPESISEKSKPPP
jgi:uncharacterized membrane protein YeaQ/YmgE (transglycosylase-associated protein family)